MDKNTLKATIKIPSVNAYTFPEGPKGRGIKEIIQDKNMLNIVYDDDVSQFVSLFNWWFGTRTEYDRLSAAEKQSKELYFIEEGS